MIHVFIDTSIYVANNFDFEGERLDKILNLVNQGHIRLYTTNITHNEIISKISEQTDTARESVNRLKREAKVLKNTSPFKSFFEEKAVNIASDEIKEKYMDFKSRTNIQNVTIYNADINEVFRRYFEELPPFSSKKKDEIPDAVVLSSLEKYFKENSDSCYVISTDNDMKNYCEEFDQLTYLETIDELLAELNKENDKFRYMRIHDIILNNEDSILETVEENILFNQYFDVLGDGDVYDVDVCNTQIISDPLIMDMGKDYARISFKVSFEYQVDYSFLDITKSPFDYETKDYLWKEYDHDTSSGSQELNVEVLLTDINFEQIHNENIDITEVNFDKDEPIFVEDFS